jgi:hypothetical protein
MVAYPIIAAEAGEVTMTYMIGLTATGLLLIFLSFLVLPMLILNYRLLKSLLLGLIMVFLNTVAWTMIFYPFFLLQGGSIINDLSLTISLVLGVIMFIIFNIYIIYQISTLRSEEELKNFRKINGDHFKLFRIVVMLFLIVLLTLIYLSPVINEGSQQTHMIELSWYEGGMSEFLITIHLLDIYWFLMLFLPISALEIQKRLQLHAAREMAMSANV